MDSLTQEHIGYLNAYLLSLSVHNSTWRTSIKTTVTDPTSDSSNFLTHLQQHHPQIISDEKQKEDSSGFSPPIRITWTPEGGRHLIASRDVTTGEVLFWEPPLMLAPKAGAGPTCLNCLRSLPEDFSSCKGCGSPLCVPHCGGSGHTVKECQSFTSGIKKPGEELQTQQEKDTSEEITCKTEMKSDEYKQNLLKKVKVLNCLMTPLRTLLLMQDSSSASDVIAAMQSNAEQRSNMPIGKFLEMQLLNPLRSCLDVQVSPPVLQHVCGIWDTNAFEMKMDNGGIGRGLLPLAGLMNHSCIPNTQHWTYRGGLLVMASNEIPQGTPITNNYVNVFLGNRPRQSHLVATKLFVCSCRRCSDLSELGSNASDLLCQECKHGLLQPLQEGGSSWKCNNCTNEIPYERVCMMVQMTGRMITSSQKEDLKGKQRILMKVTNMLGKQHYLVKQQQFILLGHILEQPIQDVNIKDLKSALGTVKDLQKYTDIIEPGYTKFKGVFLLRHLQLTAELLRRCHHDNSTLATVLAEEATVLAEEDKADMGVVSVDHTEEDINKINLQDLKDLGSLVPQCSGILQYDDVLVQELQDVTHKLQELQMQLDAVMVT